MEINANFTENAKNDFHLVVKAREGSQKAYADLMHRYKDSIYFMVLKMVNNKEDANDLTVETFAKAFEKLDKYQPDYAFSTWLFRVATNNCIDFIRNLITLRYFDELSYEEIAQQLDLPLGTVKAQLFRARFLLGNIINRVNRDDL